MDFPLQIQETDWIVGLFLLCFDFWRLERSYHVKVFNIWRPISYCTTPSGECLLWGYRKEIRQVTKVQMVRYNFIPSWDEVLRCNLHQSKAWRFCVVNSWRGDWNFKNNKMTSGQFVQRYHQVPSRISKISLLQLSLKWNSVISCLSPNWE